MSILKEFKEFAISGNLVDTAVAFVMGVSFTKVTSSLIDGMVMPIVGQLTAGVDFKSLKYVLSAAQVDANGKILVPESAIRYGEFVTVVVDFLLVAFFVFLLVRAINRIRRKEKTAEQQ